MGGGGWAGALEGRVISKYLQIGEGQTCFIRSQGRVTVFFGKENITPCRLSNTSGQLFPVPVILFCWRWEGRVRCFCLDIYEGSCINPIWEAGGPRLFWPKISKIPRPTPPPTKNVPSLRIEKVNFF